MSSAVSGRFNLFISWPGQPPSLLLLPVAPWLVRAALPVARCTSHVVRCTLHAARCALHLARVRGLLRVAQRPCQLAGRAAPCRAPRSPSPTLGPVSPLSSTPGAPRASSQKGFALPARRPPPNGEMRESVLRSREGYVPPAPRALGPGPKPSRRATSTKKRSEVTRSYRGEGHLG